jgi:hypothetical protein
MFTLSATCQFRSSLKPARRSKTAYGPRAHVYAQHTVLELRVARLD